MDRNSAMKKLSLIAALLVSVVIFTGEASAQGRVTRQEKPKTEPTEKVRPKTESQPVAQSKIELSQPDGSINGHGYVDLGLPSGLKWATCNIGASKPEQYGGYYSWGDTDVKKSYLYDNTVTAKKQKSKIRSLGIIDASDNLTPEFDAACVNWSADWRMPTITEFQELLDNCTWTWGSYAGVRGFRATGPNGRSIFFPATGDRAGETLEDVGRHINYWSSTYSDYDDGYYACAFLRTLFVGDDHNLRTRRWIRSSGCPIRPVLVEKKEISEEHSHGEIMSEPDSQPEFPGGQSAMYKWLADNIKFPPTTLNNGGVQGRVIVGFVVSKTGAVKDVKIIRSCHPALDEEVVRVVKAMPTWTPGSLNGEPVDVAYTLPLSFRQQ